MIIVVADDITGAAEMGGIGLRFGLTGVLADDVPDRVDADLLVIYTNTRSMSEAEAVRVMRDLAEKARDLRPALFYKKTDSVLRGHVLAEMKAQMNATGKEAGLLLPANPAIGRIIRDGLYYVNGQPIEQTGFRYDPEFPVTTSAVQEIVGDTIGEVTVAKAGDVLPECGIVIAEATSQSDVAAWANQEGDFFWAGGGAFFDALLRKRFQPKPKAERSVQLETPVLLVSGTTYSGNVERIKKLDAIVHYMPQQIFTGADTGNGGMDSWSNEISRTLAQNKAIVAIGPQEQPSANHLYIGDKLGEIVRLLFEKQSVRELLIEGGSTAYAVIRKLGWTRFVPTEELQQGVVRMQVADHPGLHLTIKPGSYAWPPAWAFLEEATSDN